MVEFLLALSQIGYLNEKRRFFFQPYLKFDPRFVVFAKVH